MSKKVFFTGSVLCVVFMMMSMQSFLNKDALHAKAPARMFTENITREIPKTKNLVIKPKTNIKSSVIIPRVQVRNVSCLKLFNGRIPEIQKAQALQELYQKRLHTPLDYISMTKDCESFIKKRQYTMQPLSPMEEEFPLAYSILVYKDVEQIERLLRAIYQPQNFYCFHVDLKSPKVFVKSLQEISGCFNNVFLASSRVKVVWGEYSVLEAQFKCMEELWKYKTWKYFINLSGQEFPIKSNAQIVSILKAMKGANIVTATLDSHFKNRTFMADNDKLPQNIRIVKGDLFIVVQRGFVDFVLHNDTAMAFRNWVNNTYIPDETYFPSLNHSPELRVPGSYLGHPETTRAFKDINKAIYPTLARFVMVRPTRLKCHSKIVRGVCILGVADLRYIFLSRQLFVNKLYLDYHPLAYECLEELHYRRTRMALPYNTSFYENLDVTKNHVP